MTPRLSPIGLLIFICLLSGSFPLAAGEYMTGPALRALLIGNTTTGTYPVDGVQVTWHEFMSPDGTSRYIDENGGGSTSRWEIRDDGCVYAVYEDGFGDGCYYYQDNGDGTFTVKRPWTDEPGIARIIEGDPGKLGG